MAVIVFASSKGGVGKSTSALVLSHALAVAGASVTLIDADPNSPMENWQNLSKNSEVDNFNLRTNVDETNIIDEIDSASSNSKFVIVDLEGSANMAVSYAVGRANLVIVPLQGSQLDANEAAKVIRVIKQNEKAFGRDIPYVALLSRTGYIKPRTAKHIEGLIKDAGINILPVEMTERDAFKAIFTYGGTLYDLTSEEVSNPQKAIDNAEALASSIADYLRGIYNA